VPAVTVTTAGDRPPASVSDVPDQIDGTHLGQLGRAADSLVASLDQGLELAQGTSSYVYLGPRIVRGWAIELVLFAMLLPALMVIVDLFARCRRRRISITPALRSYRSRLAFWLWAGVLFELFALAGAWPGGSAHPLNPESSAATTWPRLGIAAFAVLLAASWMVSRTRRVPRRPVTHEEELAGYAAALIAIGVVSLAVAAWNPFALIFLLPSLHFWVWLPNLRDRHAGLRAAFVLAGFLGPLLAVGSLSIRFGLGLDSPWYLAELAAIGYVSIVTWIMVLAWAAGAAQVVAVAVDRYTPYPSTSERPPRGPVRNSVRAIVLAVRARRRPAEDEHQAVEG
jgi:MFS family permease